MNISLIKRSIICILVLIAFISIAFFVVPRNIYKLCPQEFNDCNLIVYRVGTDYYEVDLPDDGRDALLDLFKKSYARRMVFKISTFPGDTHTYFLISKEDAVGMDCYLNYYIRVGDTFYSIYSSDFRDRFEKIINKYR